MEEIYIENTTLAFTILKRLVKNGIRDSVFPFESTFSQEELNSVEKITFTSTDSLEGIEILKNLKTLCIVGNSSLDDFDDVDIDYNCINSLNELQNLHIIENDNIFNLDISNLKNLKSLRLVNNENLNNIVGLSKLKKLEEVIICGNDIKDFDNPIEYIKNTMNTKINILDVIMYHKLFGSNPIIKNYLKDKINSNWSNISFGEMLYFDNECYELNFHQMEEMYIKACNIISRLNLGDNEKDNILKVYEYIVNNLEYDYDGLDMRTQLYIEKNLFQEKDNEYFKKRMLFINSSYSAIMDNKSVCDGYVNMMKFLLNIKDIESRKILCSFNDSLSIKPDHVIIKVKSDNEWYYCDPEKENNGSNLDFFMKDLEDIQKTHKISTLEKNKYQKQKKLLKEK